MSTVLQLLFKYNHGYKTVTQQCAQSAILLYTPHFTPLRNHHIINLTHALIETYTPSKLTKSHHLNSKHVTAPVHPLALQIPHH